MKNRGFTLIELIAVIGMMSIILLITFPVITGQIEKSRKNKFDTFVANLCLASESYINSDQMKSDEINGGTTIISLQELIDKGYIKNSLKNPNTKEKITGKEQLTVKLNEDKTYSCTLDDTKPEVVYKEGILNGADPVIKEKLIPVIIEDNGTVKKADIKQEWYNYGKKKWANAVVLFDGKTVEEDGTIKEENIKQYFVWIPKYSYKLWNVNSNNTNNVGKPIEITFGSKAKTTGTKNGDTYIHPAFTNFNTNGIWVGKYETSYDEETYTNKDTFLTKNIEFEKATDSNKIIVKPNVRSLSMKSISEFYTLLKNSNSNLNSHMMTNMEWGAVAYLTYSKYGRCTSTTCTEVTINNVNTGYGDGTAKYDGQWERGPAITGCAGDTVSAAGVSSVNECPNKYNTAKGYLASTTGNISGIYDMSGGSWEYVMGVLKDATGTPYSGYNKSNNSGFQGPYGKEEGSNTTGLDFPTDARYYNLYTAPVPTLNDETWWKYDTGMLGDATKEIANTQTDGLNESGLWFDDLAHFPHLAYPWFKRGGNWANGTISGMFYFMRGTGFRFDIYSTRLVLAF